MKARMLKMRVWRTISFIVVISILVLGNLPTHSEALSIIRLTVTDVALYDYSGEKVNHIEVGEQVLAMISIHNNIESNQSFVAIIEIRDGYGVTRELSWQSGNIEAGDDYTFGVSWMPTDDCWLDNDECSTNYEIRGFVVTSLNNPQILSSVAVMDGIMVAGSPPDPPLDQHQFEVLLDDGRKYTLNYSFPQGNGSILSVEDDHENDRLRLRLDTPVDTVFTLSVQNFLVSYFLGNEQMTSYEIHAFVDGQLAYPDTLFDDEARNYVFIFTLEQGVEEIEFLGIPGAA